MRHWEAHTRSFSRLKTFCAMAAILWVLCSLNSQGQSASEVSSSPKHESIGQLESGSISGDVYHNAELGFRYQFPRGWTVNDRSSREKVVKAGWEFVWGDDVAPMREKKSSRQCSRELLSVTQYPEEMRINHFNPLALLIVADPRCVPGANFPTTTQDHQAIQRVASQWGTFFETSDIFSQSTARMRAFENGGRIMLEINQSFIRSTHAVGATTVQNINSSILIMPSHDYWVLWMFASSDEPQLEKLKTTKIFFDEGTNAPSEVK